MSFYINYFCFRLLLMRADSKIEGIFFTAAVLNEPWLIYEQQRRIGLIFICILLALKGYADDNYYCIAKIYRPGKLSIYPRSISQLSLKEIGGTIPGRAH